MLPIPYLPRQHLGDLIWANAKSSSSLLIVKILPVSMPVNIEIRQGLALPNFHDNEFGVTRVCPA
jgi:hypothetical protein